MNIEKGIENSRQSEQSRKESEKLIERTRNREEEEAKSKNPLTRAKVFIKSWKERVAAENTNKEYTEQQLDLLGVLASLEGAVNNYTYEQGKEKFTESDRNKEKSLAYKTLAEAMEQIEKIRSFEIDELRMTKDSEFLRESILTLADLEKDFLGPTLKETK